MRPLLLASLVAVLGSGCSLSNISPPPCETHDDCRGLYGLGSVCDADGYCSEAQTTNRCLLTDPINLFQDGPDYTDVIPVISLSNRSETQVDYQAVQLAVASASDTGIGNHRLALVKCNYGPASDGLTTNEAISEIIGYVVNVLDAQLIIGASDTDSTLFAYNQLQSAGSTAVMISPSAMGAALSRVDIQNPDDINAGLLWRVVPQGAVFGEAMAHRVISDLTDPETEEVAGRVMVVYENSDDARELRDAIEADFDPLEAGGLTVTYDSFANADSLDERKTGLANIAAQVGVVSDLDWLVFISTNPNDYVWFLVAAEGEDPASAPLAASLEHAHILFPPYARSGMLERDTFVTQHNYFARTMEDGMPQVQGVSPAIDRESSVYQAFATDFNTNYLNVEQSGFSTHSYDAAWLGLYGMAWAYMNNGETVSAIRGYNIAQGLRRMQSGNEVAVGPSGWGANRNSLADGGSIDLVGTSGPLTFDLSTEELDVSDYPVEVWGLMSNQDCFGTQMAPHCIAPLQL